jgi:hypothetical protein
MELKFQNSFIPKKQVGGSLEKAVYYAEGTNIFSLAATLFFLGTILLYGGLFFYKKLLIKQIMQADQAVVDARTAIEPETIVRLLDADARMSATLGLLEKHLVTTNLLLLLGENTVRTLKYNDFNYRNRDGTPIITISGQVANYNGLAYQQKKLAENEQIREVKFSEIDLLESGDVKFKLESKVDFSLISYKKVLESLTNGI